MTFFDTSVLLAAFYEDHEHHAASLRVFRKASKKTACCAAHSLAELYATTTRMPARHRLAGDQAMLLVQNVSERLAIICLDARQYFEAIERAASAGVVGGTLYDALLLACAAKARAQLIYTWNVGDFQRAYPALAERVQAPS